MGKAARGCYLGCGWILEKRFPPEMGVPLTHLSQVVQPSFLPSLLTLPPKPHPWVLHTLASLLRGCDELSAWLPPPPQLAAHVLCRLPPWADPPWPVAPNVALSCSAWPHLPCLCLTSTDNKTTGSQSTSCLLTHMGEWVGDEAIRDHELQSICRDNSTDP